jgi:outer membrane protein OmpA-like peptidoglycan-associated protein/tetratricopeptide (TPR) repeat protein
MKKVTLLFTLLFISFLGFSQSKKSVYREKFTQGNLLFLEKNYPLALENYLEAYNIDSTSANINYKIGITYLEIPAKKHESVKYLEKAVKDVTHNYNPDDASFKKAPEYAYYYLGEAYRIDYNFVASYVYLKKFKDLVGDRNEDLSKDINTQLQSNTTAQEFTKETSNLKIIGLGDSINTPFPEYNPLISADESTLIFTSKRLGSTGGEKMDDDDFYEDIYVSHKKSNGTWSNAKSIGFYVNTSTNERCVGLSPDGQLLFVYKDDNGGDLYYSKLDGDTWSTLVSLGESVNSPDKESSACISVDGNTLYFVSNRKEGSIGGSDIWTCVKLPNGSWSLPTNLGSSINTPLDEEAPFIHPDGATLFFSSKGHKNMGGFDIFKSSLDATGKWSEPENLRTPINTPDNDMTYVQSTDGKRGYFASIRSGGMGRRDIYKIEFDKTIAEPLTLLKGVLTFNGSNKTPTNAKIKVTDSETGALIQEIKPNVATGKYIMILTPGVKGKKYDINFEADGYQPYATNVEITPNSSYQEIEKEYILQMINLESKTLGTMSLKGVVRNKAGKSIPGATIIIKDNLTGKLIDTFYTTSDSGSYYFVVNRGQNYNISYEAKGYLFQSENINVPKAGEYSVMRKDIVLDKLEAGSKIVLNNIFFDSNKSNLRKESALEIEKLVKLMKEYPELKIEVSGHTDSKGKDAANLLLSQARSQAVVNAVVKKGIDAKKLVAKGYGKTQPIAPNTLEDGKPNKEGMQMNRRVELKIISQ